MTTRMEKVAEDAALAVLRKASSAADPPLQPEILQEAFQARWPTTDSKMPMTDAVYAATQAAGTSLDTNRWKTTVSDVWQTAVQETIDRYFNAALRNFKEGHPLDGVEELTDAVRAALGYIAATRNWPHSNDDHLYRIAAALGSGNGWPKDTEEFDQALDSASEEGKDLCAALGASMGRPDMLKFGVYATDPDGPGRDGIMFARTTIELANRLAQQEAPAS